MFPVELGDTKVSVTAHLIDCRSYGGFSGSPCFVQFKDLPRDGGRLLIEGYSRMVDTTVLLGMVIAHYDLRRDAILTGDLAGAPGRVQTDINTGVGVVLPVERITEALMHEDLVELRDKYEKERRREEKRLIDC
jgi:hypothetical protein